MNIVISIEHPAWAHQFKYIIAELMERGDNVTVLAVDKDGDLELLDKYHIPYKLMANSTGSNVFVKAWLFVKLCATYTMACKKSGVDMLIGRLSPMMSVAAFFLRKPHVLFDDSEVCILGFTLARLFSTKMITPRCFYNDLGEKQIKVPMYKELYYLDKKHFIPDNNVLKQVGIDSDEKYVIVRFVAWKASHDFGMSGLNDEEKLEFVKRLSEHVKVYITSEKPLGSKLEPYRLHIPYELIHHVLYYAQVVISDGATMASEAVVLGTHAVRLCPIKCGTFIEQEQKYGLLKWFPGATSEWFGKGLEYTIELLKNPVLWENGKKKREILLQDMVDCNKFFIDTMDSVMEEWKENQGGGDKT